MKWKISINEQKYAQTFPKKCFNFYQWIPNINLNVKNIIQLLKADYTDTDMCTKSLFFCRFYKKKLQAWILSGNMSCWQ